MKRFFFFFFFLLLLGSSNSQVLQTPDKIYGQLFTDVQMSRIFLDSKTFVDCIPKRDPKEIAADYISIKNNPNIRFSLKLFVEQNFIVPDTLESTYFTKEKDIRKHIDKLWQVLKRESDSLLNGSSLLPLPNAYVVPGGRFREIYYWDSYFTMLGLKESGENNLIESMIKNFAFLIEQHGHVPNGNRTYYLSRSQPPFFSLMVELLASIKGDSVYKQFQPALLKELNYWTGILPHSSYFHGERINYHKWWFGPNNKKIYRYLDTTDRPRQESFYEDSMLYKRVQKMSTQKLAGDVRFRINQNKIQGIIYRHLRSAAESGWDFSSRWFTDGKTIETINTAGISPVDLNCLIWHLQKTVAKSYRITGDDKKAKTLDSMSNDIYVNLERYFWDHSTGWYMDFDAGVNKRLKHPTLAGMYPLFFKLIHKEQAAKAVEFLKANFLKPGGVVTTLRKTGQQWDAPNGWAPLQWITIIGLENYGYHDLAKEIAKRWVNLNKKVFLQTGKLMEKYNVINTNLKAGGGEYPSQDGFGWTNGVLLALMNKYKLK
jgi:alpha,alpha-trehalase